MKKLFISQPMRGKTEREILAERDYAIRLAKDCVADEVEVIDSFCKEDAGNALKYLAKSIEKLADADIAYFAAGWRENRGCRIEHECATAYGVYRIES